MSGQRPTPSTPENIAPIAKPYQSWTWNAKAAKDGCCFPTVQLIQTIALVTRASKRTVWIETLSTDQARADLLDRWRNGPPAVLASPPQAPPAIHRIACRPSRTGSTCRRRLAQDGALLGRLTRIAVETVLTFYAGRAAERGRRGAKSGAVTAVQRTSSDLRLNPHLHLIALDGAWRDAADP